MNVIQNQLNMNVLNMLNTRYIITQNGQVQRNPEAYGPVWLVNAYKIVENPDKEILALKEVNVKDTAIIDKRYQDMVKGKELTRDTNARIVNTLCAPNRLTYTCSSTKEQLVTFSEIFYDKGGWVAYLDGKEVPHFRVNYILRGMVVPAGNHNIEFKYIPHMSILSAKISNAASVVIILLLLAAAGLALYRNRKTNLLINNNKNEKS